MAACASDRSVRVQGKAAKEGEPAPPVLSMRGDPDTRVGVAGLLVDSSSAGGLEVWGGTLILQQVTVEETRGGQDRAAGADGGDAPALPRQPADVRHQDGVGCGAPVPVAAGDDEGVQRPPDVLERPLGLEDQTRLAGHGPAPWQTRPSAPARPRGVVAPAARACAAGDESAPVRL